MKSNKTIKEINQEISKFHLLRAKECLYNSEKDGGHKSGYNKDMVKHATMAADNGNIAAQSMLGMIYKDGLYANKSMFLSQKYYRLAADGGCPESKYILAKIYLGDGNTSSYTNRISIGYIKESAAAGYLPAIRLLSISYQYGKYGLGVDLKKALSGFQDLCREGDREDVGMALNSMGLIYSSSIGMPQYDLAFLCFSKAAILGLVSAKYNLGTLYQNGEGCKINHGKAYSFFREAALLGHRDSMYSLAVMYRDGIGVNESFGNCIYWLRKGSDKGDFAAKIALDLLTISMRDKSIRAEVKYYEKRVENTNNLIYIEDYIKK